VLEGWHEFYVLLGTAAAALVALLFVAASVGAGFLSADNTGPTRTFMSPIVFHYTFILLVSLVALMPLQSDAALGSLIGAVAMVGLGYSIFISVRVMGETLADRADWVGYGAGPFVAYAAMVAGAGCLPVHAATGAIVLAGALTLLLLVNIRNAWDLLLAMVRSHAKRTRDEPPDR
jgi:hypothetical protein